MGFKGPKEPTAVIKEGNLDLLGDAIRAMKNLRYLNLWDSSFTTEAFDKVMIAIVEN